MSRIRQTWSDLGPRVITAGVLLGVGILAVWAGSAVFSALVVVVAAIMIGELTVMLRRGFERKRDWALGGFYFLVIICGALGLMALADEGRVQLLFYIGIVVVTDTMGYFVGRAVGGPKFWPAISPKKTWSGVIGGWAGSAVLAVLCQPILPLAPENVGIFVLLAVAVSFASQLSDIIESALKRRAGVKDSSHLLPGHGGFMDRFDALVGVGALYYVVSLLDALV
ncbi:phosphatidate cytidylyltransferase [Aliiroseovarius sp. PTFE2010]|uniref:phosphatidate cytidylyltransferase n=1 Tax=Aliiroseovarius sp. PTFE2010 TaxID=3417190 RepID=UPI003CF8F1C3